MFGSIGKFFSDLYDAFVSGKITYPSLKEVVGRVVEVFYAPQADPVATIMSSLFLINIFAIILVIVLWLVLRRNDNRVLKQQRKDFAEQTGQLGDQDLMRDPARSDDTDEGKIVPFGGN